MKAILSRLFNHEELTREEAKELLLNITKGMYNDSPPWFFPPVEEEATI